MSTSIPILFAIFCMLWSEVTWKFFEFMFWSDFGVFLDSRILAKISVILTTRKHWKIDIVGCQTKKIECGCAVNGNFELTVTVLNYDCIEIT